MQRFAVVAACLLVFLPGLAVAGDGVAKPVGTAADEVTMIPLGPARSTSHINEKGHLVKESSQRFLQLRGATPQEVKFFTDFALLTGSLPRATQNGLLKKFTPKRLVGRVELMAHTCSGTCVEHCSVMGCDVTASGCSTLICAGSQCPSSPNNTCTKNSSPNAD